MSMLVQNKYHRLAAVALASATLLFSSLVTAVRAQQPSAVHSSHAPASANDEASLTEQLKQLQSKVAQLEAALKQNHQGMAGPPAPSGGMAGQAMPMMDDELGGMQPGQGMQGMGMGSGMMQREMSGMSSMQSGQGMNGMGMMRQRGMMSGQGMPGMGMDGMSGMGGGGMGVMGMEGMRMMGQMPGMGAMQMPSALPGFPGASHIYHIGATGFFLDHPQHISLTAEQQAALNRIKQQALLDQSTVDRWIDQGEQEIWVLTSSDTPDINQIEAKVREVEKVRGDKRIAFIRAVGEAAAVLTDEQRQTLVGSLQPDHSPAVGGN